MIRQFAQRMGHHVHDLCLFSCLAYFEGHWVILTLCGLGVTTIVVVIGLTIWEEVQ